MLSIFDKTKRMIIGRLNELNETKDIKNKLTISDIYNIANIVKDLKEDIFITVNGCTFIVEYTNENNND